MARGHSVDRADWPESGPHHDLLQFLDRVHSDNGRRSLRTIAAGMHLKSPTGVGEILRGLRLPADEQQLTLLVQALGGGKDELREGQILYGRAADQPSRSDGPVWWSRCGYVSRVAELAPDDLLDRDADLDRLASFTASDQSYLRIVAEPWAGKTALLSWFVLHPPPRTDVISFFVLARDATQSTAEACTDALAEQLAALSGAPYDLSVASPAARDAVRRRLFTEAAASSARRRRRLVIVIDGIDEDRGSRPGSGMASIASLLPRRPPDAVRVIVAGRPDPPVPADVPDQHPYRTAAIHPLPPSPHAAEKGRLARHELESVLNLSDAGATAARDIIGLLCAADSALTLIDIEDLTGRPTYEIDASVRSFFGRTVAVRGAALQFTHDTLRVMARDLLGSRSLRSLRQRIHTWADVHRSRGWPADTPVYLLRDYGRTLAAEANTARLTDLACDEQRHRRLAAATGGHRIAYGEICDAQQLVLANDQPNVALMARLAAHRRRLAARSAAATVELIRIWGRQGERSRAEILESGLHDAAQRAWSLSELTGAIASRGRRDEAFELARSINHEPARYWALASVAEAYAGARETDQARTALDAITDPATRRSAADFARVEDENQLHLRNGWSSGGQPEPLLHLLAVQLGLTGRRRTPQPSTPSTLSGLVTRALRSTSPSDRATAVAEIAVTTSTVARARELTEQAEAVAADVWTTPVDDEAASALALAFARNGDVARTFAWLDQLDGYPRALTATYVLEELKGSLPHDVVRDLVDRFDGLNDNFLRERALALVADHAAVADVVSLAHRMTQPIVLEADDPDEGSNDWPELDEEPEDWPEPNDEPARVIPGTDPLFDIDPDWIVRASEEDASPAEWRANRHKHERGCQISDAEPAAANALFRAGRRMDALEVLQGLAETGLRVGDPTRYYTRYGHPFAFPNDWEWVNPAIISDVTEALDGINVFLEPQSRNKTAQGKSQALPDELPPRNGEMTSDDDRELAERKVSRVLSAVRPPASPNAIELFERTEQRFFEEDYTPIQKIELLMPALRLQGGNHPIVQQITDLALSAIGLMTSGRDVEESSYSLINSLLYLNHFELAAHTASRISPPPTRRLMMHRVLTEAVHTNQPQIIDEILQLANDRHSRVELIHLALVTALQDAEDEDEASQFPSLAPSALGRMIEAWPESMEDSEICAWFAVTNARHGSRRMARTWMARALADDEWAPICFPLAEVDPEALRALGDTAQPLPPTG